jgi:pectinesterase
MRRRHFLRHGVAAGALLFAPRLRAEAFARDERCDAFVTRVPGRGAHVYPSVSAALLSAPRDGARPWRIGIDVGVWHEKLVIDRPNVHLVGMHRHATVLQHDTAAGTPRGDGEVWGTWGCASVRVVAPDFRASNLTIANAFDYLGELTRPTLPAIGPNGAQAVALMLDRGSDRAWLRDVDLVGHQDTLLVDAGRSVFERCRISGSVDFVFGGGRAWFDRCDLVSRLRPDKPRQGYVAVPSTSRAQAQGLVFDRCRLVREAYVPDASVALGRAWRPGRQFADGKYGDPDALGCAVYRDCWMDAHIAPEGWDPMAYTARDGTRVMLDPMEARLFEFGSRGPGARRSATRRVLDAPGAEVFSRERVLGGWELSDEV